MEGVGDGGSGGVEMLEVMPLGAGQEVGRSCIVMSYRGKRVMLDCGIHPAYTGLASLPFFDEVDLSTVDACLVTHFHLDHCAAVPYLVGRTDFAGKLLMTHATKAIYYTLMCDYVRVARGGRGGRGGGGGGGEHGAGETATLFSQEDVEASMQRITVIDFGQTLELCDGVRVTAHIAGHVVGAAMFTVDVGDCRVLYTGDYSRLPDRHLPGAETPRGKRPDALIVESTYGVQNHSPRLERERYFTNKIHQVLRRGGRCLLPVVALGRAQELLLILDEYWEQHPELQRVPVYQVSALAKRSISVFQTYINAMNESIRAAFEVANPFVFRHVQHLSGGAEQALEGSGGGPCVVMATPSMLQSGVSRELFETWCTDSRNGIIVCDFAVEGTLAREVLQNPPEVTTRSGLVVPLRMSVDNVSFSAHADYAQTQEFVDTVQPKNVILVHGEANEMGRLKQALTQKATLDGLEMGVFNPKVCQTVEIACEAKNEVLVVGELARDAPERLRRPSGAGGRKPGGGGDGQEAGAAQAAPAAEDRLGTLDASHGTQLRGLLVRKGFNMELVSPGDLGAQTPLKVSRIFQRQTVPMKASLGMLRLSLEQMFDGMARMAVTSPGEGEGPVDWASMLPVPPAQVGTERLLVGGHVALSQAPGEKGSHVLLEWESDSISDLVADAVVAVILQLEDHESGSDDDEEGGRARAEKRARLLGGHVEDPGEVVLRLLSAQFASCRASAAKDAALFKGLPPPPVKSKGKPKAKGEGEERWTFVVEEPGRAPAGVAVVRGGGDGAAAPAMDYQVVSADEALRRRLTGVLERLMRAMAPTPVTYGADEAAHDYARGKLPVGGTEEVPLLSMGTTGERRAGKLLEFQGVNGE